MGSFQIVPSIAEYREFGDFAEAAKLNASDLIFTSGHTYTSDLEALHLPCQILLRSRYAPGEPTDAMIDAILADLRGRSFRRLIAVGGGTILDIAKVLAVAEPEDTVDALYDRAADLRQVHPLFLVPTTCGTGSEVTGISIINRTSKGTKQGLVSPAMFPEQAVLTPGLLRSLPYSAFATASMDAMIHAVESFLSPKATPWSEIFSEQALGLILPCWKRAADTGREDGWKSYAGEFLRGSNYAGIAFGNAGCGAVHALSYPLGGTYHVPHGEANGVLFASVMRQYKGKKPLGKINRLEALLASCLDCPAEEALECLFALMDRILASKPIRAYGVREPELAVFADNVVRTQQRLLGNNYTPLTRDEILAVYESAF